MKRWLSLVLAVVLMMTTLSGCCVTGLLDEMDYVTAQDTVDAVNRAGERYENSFYAEKYTESAPTDSGNTLFSFSYLNGVFSVVGTADEAGEVLNVHTMAFTKDFSEDVEKSTYTLLAVIPAIACHETLADADIEEAMEEMFDLFSDNLSGNKSTFTSNGYEFTLQVTTSSLLVSAIKQE